MAKESRDFEIVSTTHTPALQKMLAKPDAGANPFKIVIDPKVRMDLRRALIDLIDYHDETLAEHFAEGKLALDSYKEYIELFARSLKETMESHDGGVFAHSIGGSWNGASAAAGSCCRKKASVAVTRNSRRSGYFATSSFALAAFALTSFSSNKL